MPKISQITAAKFRSESIGARLDALAQLAVDGMMEGLVVVGRARSSEEAQALAESRLLDALTNDHSNR